MLASYASCFSRLVIKVKPRAFLRAHDGRDGRVGKRSQEAGVARGVGRGERTRKVLTVGSGSVRDEEATEKRLEGWQDEMVTASDLGAVTGEDGG